MEHLRTCLWLNILAVLPMGDTTPRALLIAVACISGALLLVLLIVLFVRRRKQKH